MEEDDQFFSVEEYERKVQKMMPPPYLGYYNYGRERGWCLRDSTQAFSRYRIRNRVLQGVSQRTLSTTVLGESIPYPIGVAPTAFHYGAHHKSEAETGRGAAAADALMILSVDSNTTIADVSAAAPGGLRWMQTYLFNDRALTRHIVKEAERAGFKAVVITVDSPVPGVESKAIKDALRILDMDNPAHQYKFCFWQTSCQNYVYIANLKGEGNAGNVRSDHLISRYQNFQDLSSFVTAIE